MTPEIRLENLKKLVAKWKASGYAKSYAAISRKHPTVDASYISQLVNGNRNFCERAARNLEESLGLEPFYFDKVVDGDNVVVGKIEADIQIPIYAAYFCCGDGNDSDFEELKGYRGFSPDFFKTRNIKPDNFVLVCAANDSMSPHIEHKDEVGIDVSDKEIKDGEVYAILLDGAKMFKQVFVEAGGNLRLHSFNPNYPDKLITPQNHNSLIVVGRKVYRAG